MSDFLRNLRSSHKKEIPPTRKSHDGHYYPQDDRRILRDRRSFSPASSLESLTKQLGDVLPILLENSSVLAEQVEKLVALDELAAESRIRQHNAVADFFETMNSMLAKEPESGLSENSVPKATTSYASGTHYTKDDILSIIQKMRNQGATFSVIAEHLREKGIPTFSGRGEWHAQTIHRLCK